MIFGERLLCARPSLSRLGVSKGRACFSDGLRCCIRVVLFLLSYHCLGSAGCLQLQQLLSGPQPPGMLLVNMHTLVS